MKRILIIDDDQDLCLVLRKYLEKEGYETDCVYTGSAGILKAEEKEYQLIVLDLMLPEIDGFSVLNTIRIDSQVPVLMLTARGDEEDKVRGLKRGADDYMTKPFSIPEFLARVESLIRRYTLFGQKKEDVITYKSMKINGDTRTVIIGEEEIDLTGKEFDLLYLLASQKGRVFTKRQIYKQVWNEEYAYDDSNIMAFVSKLRKKIEIDPGAPKYIQTVRGVGYRFCKEE